MPLVGSPPWDSSRASKKAKDKLMTPDEHLATAALQLTQERNKLVAAKEKALKGSIIAKLAGLAQGTRSAVVGKLMEATESNGVCSNGWRF